MIISSSSGARLNAARSRLLFHLRLVLTTAGFLAAAGCANTPRTTTDEPDLQASVQRLAIKHGICAVAVGVVMNRKLDSVATANGCTPGKKPPANTVFEAASLSKTVFSYLVLKLVREGKISLDAPVLSYLSQGYRHKFDPFTPTRESESAWVEDPRLRAVTVRMVLNHTSGLPNWSGGPLEFEAEPGSRWIYSGEGYVFLQRAVETVTKQALEQLMESHVFQPLRMHHSSYKWEPRFEKLAAMGTTSNGESFRLGRFPVAVAAASLHTTAEDYGRFLASVLGDRQTLDLLLNSPVPVDRRLNVSWGLGWGLEQRGEEKFIWQWGNNPGYRAFTMSSVASGDGVVIFTNSDEGMMLAEQIAREVLPGTHGVFRMPVLRNGLAYVLCKELDICI